MLVRWISLKNAKKFVREHHRHRPTIQGGIVALGLWVGTQLRGVAILGRGARLDPPDLIIITRVCSDGYPNACSKLYSKAKRLAQALGFDKIKTFTELEEPGTSLVAAGLQHDGETAGGKWSRPG